MPNEQMSESRPAPQPHRMVTLAGSLLRAVEAVDGVDLPFLALRVGVPVGRLIDCRDGVRPLEAEIQVVLAALIIVLAPQHARLARRVHAHAQSALRVQIRMDETREIQRSSNRW